MRFTPQEEDLIRWLYVIAGLSRARLARDFECSIGDIEEIVSTGLGHILNSASKAAKGEGKPCKLEFQTASVQPQARAPKTEREQLFESFRRALTEF